MASTSAPALRRALLYVPASSSRMLTKSLALKTDNVTYDLEDSVTPNRKPAAREQLRAHLSEIHASGRPQNVGEIAVRINAVSTPFAREDLQVLSAAPQPVDVVVVPKVDSASDLQFVSDVLDDMDGVNPPSSQSQPIKLLALIESAKAVMDLREICTATPRLTGLIFAAEDFANDLNITRTPSLTEFLYARSAVVTAARAFGLSSAIDLVCTAYQGDAGIQRLEEECRNGKQMGFNGKQCIHPAQLEVVQSLFGPTKDEAEWAVRIAIADEKASNSGRGAWTMDGKMIDSPVVKRAQAILANAESCGMDIDSLRSKWRDQEPE